VAQEPEALAPLAALLTVLVGAQASWCRPGLWPALLARALPTFT